MRTEWTPEQISPTAPAAPAPPDVQLDMPDPTVALCPSCVDAYRNGIEPGETACECRARDENDEADAATNRVLSEPGSRFTVTLAGVAGLDREIAELQASDRDLERRHA